MHQKSYREYALPLLITASLAEACKRTPQDIVPKTPPQDALNDQLVRGDRRLSNPPLDPSVSFGIDLAHEMLTPGRAWMVRARFGAPGANVVGIGVRFGESGPITVLTSSAVVGRNEGVIAIDVPVPPGICDGLGEGEPDPVATNDWSWAPRRSLACHELTADIYAVTADDKVSAPARQAVGMKCNDCDEPSCRAIFAECGDCLTGSWVGVFRQDSGETAGLLVEMARGARPTTARAAGSARRTPFRRVLRR